MLKEKNKPIYKGIIALFSTILVILLGFTINVNATSLNGEYLSYDPGYEYNPTFLYSYGGYLIDGQYDIPYYFGVYNSFENIVPHYRDNEQSQINYPYAQGTYGNEFLAFEQSEVMLNTEYSNIEDYSISFDSYLQFSNTFSGVYRQLNYYFENFYYEQEDYNCIPQIYTLNEDKYYNVEYLVDAEYLNPTTHEMERRTFTQTIFATQEFYLIPNLIGYIYTLAPNETYPNTLFKVHYSQCYISLNNESVNTALDYDNRYVYHCLDYATSEYYKDIDDKFYNIKANNQNSVTETLGEQIGGFLDIEILPGLSFLGILGLALGIPLLIWILKLFFGG